jgi:gluconokinase
MSLSRRSCHVSPVAKKGTQYVILRELFTIPNYVIMSPTIILLMGVSGSGKTAVGSKLAENLGIPFVDPDDLHPEENVLKMAAGIPLTDDDRRPWLLAIRKTLEEYSEAGSSAIVACSALKGSYRRLLLEGLPEVKLVYLRGSREVLQQRLAERTGHFFDPSLLDSQLETLEEPTRALIVDIASDLEAVVGAVETALRRSLKTIPR